MLQKFTMQYTCILCIYYFLCKLITDLHNSIHFFTGLNHMHKSSVRQKNWRFGLFRVRQKFMVRPFPTMNYWSYQHITFTHRYKEKEKAVNLIATKKEKEIDEVKQELTGLLDEIKILQGTIEGGKTMVISISTRALCSYRMRHIICNTYML